MRLKIVYHTLLTSVVGMLITGCASPRHTAWPAPRPLGSQYGAKGQPPAGLSANAREPLTEPTGVLTLPQAFTLALLHNPALTAYSYEVRAAEARSRQARLLPNPELEVGISEYDRGGDGFDGAEAEITLAQLLEMGGKRRWRRRAAEAENELAGWDYERARLDIFASTARKAVAVLAAQHTRELANASVKLAEQTHFAATERVKAGKEPALQASRAAAELELARIDLVEAESTLEVSRQSLAAMWGSERPRFETFEGDLDSVLAAIPPMDLLRPLLSRNPDLARYDAELRLNKATLSSEKATRVPDLEVAVGLQHFEEDKTDSIAFSVGLPLPLFDRNQGNIAAARYDVARAKAERMVTETTLATELAQAHAILTSAHARVLTLRSKVVPAMQEAYESAHEGYKQGKFEFLDMLDAQRGLFEAQGTLLKTLHGYHIALAELQRITGTSMEELTTLKQER